MVQADADGAVVLLAPLEELAEELAGLVVVRVEIARVDADLLHHRHHGHGDLGAEVDVGYQGDIGLHAAADFPEGGDVGEGGHGDADDLRACLN